MLACKATSRYALAAWRRVTRRGAKLQSKTHHCSWLVTTTGALSGWPRHVQPISPTNTTHAVIGKILTWLSSRGSWDTIMHHAEPMTRWKLVVGCCQHQTEAEVHHHCYFCCIAHSKFYVLDGIVAAERGAN